MRKNLFSFSTLCVATFVLLTFITNTAVAIPAYPYPVKYTQPDGSVVTIMIKGDEFIKTVTTQDGYTLMVNEKGGYEYATHDKKMNLVPSGIIAQDASIRTAKAQQFLSKTTKGITYSTEQLQMLKSIKAIKKSQAASSSFPTTGNLKLLCILIGFQDQAFSKTQSDFQNLFNQVNYSTDGATGSVKDYHLEASYNQLNLTVDVAGPYTAANNMSYYGKNNSYGNDQAPRSLVTEAVNLANSDVNYADFDNNNDGSVDGVYIIYAGYGEEAGGSSNAIWAHAWNIPTVTLDGKTISKYSCSAELRGNSGSGISRIGVICHEFGHVLGAPDYYDTNYTTGGSYNGTGNWDIMASGSWNNGGATPAHHNVFTKVKVYDWASATVLTEEQSLKLYNSAENSSSFYQINTKTSGEYFLLENRQQKGFDSSLPGHGMIIYHVDADVMSHFSYNNINATHPQLMYPVCASASSDPSSTASSYGSINNAGCAFPGTSDATSFTDATTPSSKSWAGVNTEKPITNIVEVSSDNTITFDFMKNTPPINDGAIALENGVTATGSITSSKTSVMYYIDVPEGTTSMRVVLDSGSNDYDLYGKAGAEPTTSSSDWKGYTNGGEDETISNPTAGRHYILVQQYTGIGSFTLNATLETPSGNVLTAGVASTGTLSASSTSEMWSITVPANTSSMRVVLECGSADFDLYGKAGSEPTTSSSDWKGYTYGGEDVTVSNPSSGTHYILVNRYNGSSNYTITVTFNGSSNASPQLASLSSKIDIEEEFINIFSNQSRGISILANKGENTIKGVNIVSITGQIVHLSNNISTGRLEVENLETGCYIVRVQGEKKMHTRKVMVQ